MTSELPIELTTTAVATPPTAQPDEAKPGARRKRVLGLDVARAIAILGIFIAHYGGTPTGEAEGWPESVKKFTDGRALPVFVLLAGVGFTFLTRRAAHPVRETIGRCVVLFFAGLLFEGTTTIFLILQFYALYFLVALAFRKLSDRALLVSAGVFVIAGWLVHTFGHSHLPISLTYLQYGLGHDFGAISMLAHPKDLFTALFLNGTYPLVPTFAFFLVGMWLGRQDLNDMQLRKKIGAIGLVMFVGATAIGFAAQTQREERRIFNGPLAEIEAAGALGAGAAGTGASGTGATDTTTPSSTLDDPTSTIDPATAAAIDPAAAGTDTTLPSIDSAAAGTIDTTLPSIDSAAIDPATAAAIDAMPTASSETTDPQAELAKLTPKMTVSRALWSATDQRGHSNMPAWMIAVTGFALVLVVVCLYFSERFVGIATVLAHGGQLALTAYLGHIMLKRWVLTEWPYSYSAAAALGLIVAGFAGFVLFSTLWRRKFSQGPLEMLLRKAGALAATGSLR
jgi:uncharacterized membrane protein YeiB